MAEAFKMEITNTAPEPQEMIVVNLTRLARHTGYSVSHLSRIFNRETTPSVQCLTVLAENLGLEMGELMTRILEAKIGSSKNS